MPRTTNPAAKVLDFFQSQPLAVAETVFALARTIVLQRTKQEGPPTRKPRKKRKIGVSATPPPSEATPLGQEKRPRQKRRTKAEMAESRQRMDALQGLEPGRPAKPPRPPGLPPETIGDEA